MTESTESMECCSSAPVVTLQLTSSLPHSPLLCIIPLFYSLEFRKIYNEPHESSSVALNTRVKGGYEGGVASNDKT